MLWIVLLVLVGGGVWLYRRLQRLEGEIRTEIDTGKEERRRSKPVVVQEQRDDIVEQDSTLEEQLLGVIKAEPGIAQTDIYPHFPEQGRDLVQKSLRGMARDGLVRRERKGSSYRLYPT